jgi:hypothetical protein
VPLKRAELRGRPRRHELNGGRQAHDKAGPDVVFGDLQTRTRIHYGGLCACGCAGAGAHGR